MLIIDYPSTESIIAMASLSKKDLEYRHDSNAVSGINQYFGQFWKRDARLASLQKLLESESK
ncbi:hypothetical protein QT991_26110, partial [Microcoleus sp. S36a_D3]|uniref:hypothetical protein n=1 Tax=unclassified Microcoleus TaxID=2642155 RepID=UPI002FD500E3